MDKSYYYYVIEPYLATHLPTSSNSSSPPSPFLTLQQYLSLHPHLSFPERKSLLLKCKNLLDNLSLHGQVYCGLNTRNVVVDEEEGTLFLMPFGLEVGVVGNTAYERSYCPREVLSVILSGG